MAIQWSDQYSVLDDEIDTQHKKLFALGSRLYELAGTTGSIPLEPAFKEVLLGLVAYTQEHFSHEESYLQQLGYSKLEQHKLEHQGFLQRLNGLLEELEDTDTTAPRFHREAGYRMILFVTDWISRHIRVSDKDYCREFQKRAMP